MIVTIVCDVLGDENNGTTIAGMNLIRYLKSVGHTVRVLCADQDKKGIDGYYVVPNRDFGKILNAYVKKVGVTLAKPVEETVISAIEGSDVVHIMIPLSLGINAVKVATNLDIPITAGFHMQAENLTSYFKLNKVHLANKLVYKFIYKYVYQYVDGIHYPTQFIRDVFEHSIKKSTPGYVISNGINDYVQKRKSNRPTEWGNNIAILSTGRYAREKSQDTLIKAIYNSKYKDRIQLILAGQGPKIRYYHKLSKKLPIPPIFGLYSRTAVIDILNACDLYVHPAEVELEGISCLEAIACGKLVIVSDSKLSATKNFAVEKTCIFKNRNPVDLARVIDYFIDNEDEKVRCESLYLKAGKTFNQTQCMIEMEKMMKEVIRKHKKASRECH